MRGVQLHRAAPIAAMGLLALTAVIVQLSPTPDVTARATRDDANASSSSASRAGLVEADTATAVPQDTNQVVTARRGTLTQTIALTGRIGATDEVPLSFQSPQRVATLNVKPGDGVTAGQVLVEADGRELARNLSDARDRLTAAETKYNQAQALASSQQQATEHKQAAAQAKIQRAVADAESGERRAEADLERVRSGASTAERRGAETTVASARAGVARAESDLARLQKGPSDLDLRQAQQQVATTQIALAKAQTDYQRLSQGADPTLLRAAQQDVLNAQNVLAKAQADLQRLASGDPVALAAAQREVQRAQTTLRVAQLPPITSSSSSSSSGSSSKSNKSSASDNRTADATRKAAIQDAQFTLQGATERLQTLQAGPSPSDVMISQRTVAAATSALDSARTRLEIVARGPDQATLNQAKSSVDAAQITYDAAVASLASLQDGPDPDALSAARAAYDSSQAAIRAAVAQQQELLSHPTAAELADAQDKLKAAQDTLEQARAATDVDDSDIPAQGTADVDLLKQAADQERSAVQSLERDIMDSKLTTPIDGTVIAVSAQVGAGVDAGKPVVVLARSDADPIVVADTPVPNGVRLTVGQTTAIRYSGSDKDVAASIADVTDTGTGNVRVKIQPTWLQDRPTFGIPASIQVVTQVKPDVVILPTRSLLGSGIQRTVQVLDGDQPKTVPVEVGLVVGDDAEIVSGITPDASVLTTNPQPGT
jgi:multidrug resistance efflux pump